MRRLSQALLALLFACRAHAEAQAPHRCFSPLDRASQPQSATEVVVWVNEEGHAIRTESNHVTATTAMQENTHATGSYTSATPVETEAPHNAWAIPSRAFQQQPTQETRPTFTDRLQKKPGPPVPHPYPAQHPRPDHHEDHQRQFGIAYSPYNADRSCKTQEQVNKDLDQLTEYAFVRIYGTDCDQTTTVTSAARRHHMQVFAGVFDLNNFHSSLKAFNDVATLPNGRKDWSVFHTIAIGNELVNSGTAAPADVTRAVNEARTILRQQGYQGPVVTVDTSSVLIQHPELCRASDYCALNCHAFFDASQVAHNAGPYVLGQAHAVSAAAGGKHTMITESGWPHAGQPNGAAIPSPENQRVAIESLRRSFAHRKDDLVLFTAYDDLWKQDNQYTFNAERFWGIYER